MTIRSILHVIRPDDDITTLDKALDLTEQSKAYLNILVAGEMPVPMVSAYDMVNSDIWARQSDEIRTQVQTRANAIETILSERSIAGAVFGTVVQAANLPDVIGRAARYNDLTFMIAGPETDKQFRDTIISGSLFESGSPILICSSTQTPRLDPQQALIGWNATPQAGRAVRGAIGLLKETAQVTAVLIDPEPSFTGHGEEPGANLATYLGHHGISAVVERLPSEGHKTEDILRRKVNDIGAEILVMGGYGHSRLRQRILGGTTSSFFDNPPCPLFMAH